MIAHYTGKLCPIGVVPNLGPGHTNPGLNLRLDGELKKGAVVMHAIPRALFGQRAANMSLFQTILQEPAVPPAVPEDWTLTVRVFQGPGAAVVHTIVHPFKIAKTRRATRRSRGTPRSRRDRTRGRT